MTAPTPPASTEELIARLRSEKVRGHTAGVETGSYTPRINIEAADELQRLVNLLAAPPPGGATDEKTATGGWLPNVLCPTDGVWRTHLMPDGSEVIACHDGFSIGPYAHRWRIKEFAYHTPARPTGEVYGGVEQMRAPYDTFVIKDMPEGVYPTHFRPNDTVRGAPK